MTDDPPREYHDEIAVHDVPGPEDPSPADVPRGESDVPESGQPLQPDSQ